MQERTLRELQLNFKKCNAQLNCQCVLQKTQATKSALKTIETTETQLLISKLKVYLSVFS